MTAPGSLDDLQTLFWQAITWPTGVAAFLAQADPTTRSAFAGAFVDGAPVSARQRLDVYANSYFWRLHGVLEENHPVVAWLLGETRFRNLATDYVLAHPSTNPDLRRFSRRLPDLLAGHDSLPSWLGQALAEIATIELHVGDFLHAPDETSITHAELHELPAEAWPTLRVRLCETLALVDVSADYIALDQARRAAEPPPKLQLDPTVTREAVGHLLGPAQTVVVWRRGHAVLRRAVPQREATALRAVQGGANFTELCVALAATHDPGDADPKVHESAASAPSQAFMAQLAMDTVALIRAWASAGLLRADDDAPSGSP